MSRSEGGEFSAGYFPPINVALGAVAVSQPPNVAIPSFTLVCVSVTDFLPSSDIMSKLDTISFAK